MIVLSAPGNSRTPGSCRSHLLHAPPRPPSSARPLSLPPLHLPPLRLPLMGPWQCPHLSHRTLAASLLALLRPWVTLRQIRSPLPMMPTLLLWQFLMFALLSSSWSLRLRSTSTSPWTRRFLDNSWSMRLDSWPPHCHLRCQPCLRTWHHNQIPGCSPSHMESRDHLGSRALQRQMGEVLQYVVIAQALVTLAQRWQSWSPHMVRLVTIHDWIPGGRASGRPWIRGDGDCTALTGPDPLVQLP